MKQSIEKANRALVDMNIKDMQQNFSDCDWMQTFLRTSVFDYVLWLIYRVEELEQQLKRRQTMSVENCGTQVQAKEGQVNQELNNAENTASRLVARIDELEKRLFEVLHASEAAPPTLNKEAQEVEAALVPLASRIRDHYKLLQNLGTHVGEMLDRLEIR